MPPRSLQRQRRTDSKFTSRLPTCPNPAQRDGRNSKRALDSAIAANTDLQGQEQQFKEYASKPSHRGAPAQVLVDAFLHKSTSTPTPKSTPGSVLERGSGGPKDSVKPHKYSTEEM